MQINDILAGVLKGEFDADLRALADAIKARREVAAQNSLYAIRPDDLVRIGGIRPKALNGLTAKVVKTNRTTLTVRLGEEAGRHQGIVRIPIRCCEKVPANA